MRVHECRLQAADDSGARVRERLDRTGPTSTPPGARQPARLQARRVAGRARPPGPRTRPATAGTTAAAGPSADRPTTGRMQVRHAASATVHHRVRLRRRVEPRPGRSRAGPTTRVRRPEHGIGSGRLGQPGCDPSAQEGGEIRRASRPARDSRPPRGSRRRRRTAPLAPTDVETPKPQRSAQVTGIEVAIRRLGRSARPPGRLDARRAQARDGAHRDRLALATCQFAGRDACRGRAPRASAGRRCRRHRRQDHRDRDDGPANPAAAIIP